MTSQRAICENCGWVDTENGKCPKCGAGDLSFSLTSEEWQSRFANEIKHSVAQEKCFCLAIMCLSANDMQKVLNRYLQLSKDLKDGKKIPFVTDGI
jgi:hypothetical protein